jgi:hypothetical protein
MVEKGYVLREAPLRGVERVDRCDSSETGQEQAQMKEAGRMPAVAGR